DQRVILGEGLAADRQFDVWSRLFEVGDILIAERHRAARLVVDAGGAALIGLDGELARKLQWREERPQLLEHLALLELVVDRPELRVLRLDVGDVDLRIGRAPAGRPRSLSAARRRRG